MKKKKSFLSTLKQCYGKELGFVLEIVFFVIYFIPLPFLTGWVTRDILHIFTDAEQGLVWMWAYGFITNLALILIAEILFILVWLCWSLFISLRTVSRCRYLPLTKEEYDNQHFGSVDEAVGFVINTMGARKFLSDEWQFVRNMELELYSFLRMTVDTFGEESMDYIEARMESAGMCYYGYSYTEFEPYYKESKAVEAENQKNS